VTITDGADPDDVPLGTAPDGARFTLARIGTLYGTARRRAVPGALDALTREGALDASSHGLRIVGNAAIAPERGTLHGLPHRSRRHRHALEEITSATALVLYEPPGGER
jgi:hypothetical protein